MSDDRGEDDYVPARDVFDRGPEPSLKAFVDAWNRQQGLVTPRLHNAFIDWLQPDEVTDRKRLLLMAFRGSGKSTVIGLYAAWQLRCDPKTTILVVAADLALATKMVRFVKRVIERHPMTDIIRPKKPDLWTADQFTILRTGEQRDPSMLARGIVTNVTGSRASLIICDDVEVPNTSGTPYKRAELRERLRELDYVLTPDGVMLFAGTPHNYYSIYAEEPRPELDETEPFLHGYERLTRPLLDEAGKSVWPERFPDDGVQALIKRSGPNRFASQMMLQPLSPTEGRLNPDLMQRYDAEIERWTANGVPRLSIGGVEMADVSCWWDPSVAAAGQGDRGGDASVVVAVFIDKNGGFWVHRALYLSVDPEDKEKGPQQQCAAVARFAGELDLPGITIETNGVGVTFPMLLRQALAEARVGCNVLGVSSAVKSKADRIIDALDARLAAGMIHAHGSVYRSGLVLEMREWRPSGRNRTRDDGLDALAGAVSAKPVRIASARRVARGQDWRQGAQPVVADTSFSVW